MAIRAATTGCPRYGFAERHMAGALTLLAEQSGLSVTELRSRLGRLPD